MMEEQAAANEEDLKEDADSKARPVSQHAVAADPLAASSEATPCSAPLDSTSAIPSIHRRARVTRSARGVRSKRAVGGWGGPPAESAMRQRDACQSGPHDVGTRADDAAKSMAQITRLHGPVVCLGIEENVMEVLHRGQAATRG
eukprot:CAMPEP_0180525052 /NCGR_PEP_ID=MMETSP1036_2-20121128/58960_1 /TAXON_ID=632150 /ORGANISM="Azadinium spinosum, Strain 3D9" /LENGTH=143 /DNA_ID=CAMNT_0022538321 /DNA_START=254 /DNA_END=685 /DNA_ORIENTATION=+